MQMTSKSPPVRELISSVNAGRGQECCDGALAKQADEKPGVAVTSCQKFAPKSRRPWPVITLGFY